jgi:hypothetical protein
MGPTRRLYAPSGEMVGRVAEDWAEGLRPVFERNGLRLEGKAMLAEGLRRLNQAERRGRGRRRMMRALARAWAWLRCDEFEEIAARSGVGMCVAALALRILYGLFFEPHPAWGAMPGP